MRFGFIGSILPHKGLHLAAEAFGSLDPERATLDAWGDATIAPEYTARIAASNRSGAVRLHAPFPEAEKDAVFAGLDVLIAPSLGLESYGLACREAMARGVPVLASRRGALAELFEGRDCGAHLDVDAPDAVGAIRHWVERLVAGPSRLDEWRRNLPPVRCLEDSAQQIEGLYAEVLRDRGGRA